MPGIPEGTGERVTLTVPASPQMWSVVRMTASVLANQLNFTFDDIEDLRLAVTELCSSCAVGTGEGARCECQFTIGSDCLEMHCNVSPVSDSMDPPEEGRLLTKLELSEQILLATTDEHSIGQVVSGVRQGYLRKERTPAALS
jgi:hypothetical protein